MKRIGEAASGDLLAALDRLERSRAAASASSQARPAPAVDQPRSQAAVIRDLAAERTERRKADAKAFVHLAKTLGLAGEALNVVKRAADAAQAEPNEWTFVMISPQQNAAVVRWIAENSSRPIVAARLWAELFAHMRSDTGEILETRQQLADRLGIEPDNLTRVMSELESINAIRRERRGRRVVYYMNPNIATHLPQKARQAAQKRAGPLLILMQGGQPDAED